jgi:hypothetical protein
MSPVLKPLTKDNATGNGVASVDDLVRLSSSILGAVDQTRLDMNRRFKETNAKLDDVCTTVGGILTARAIEAALSKQTAEMGAANEARAESHMLSLRWRVGIGISAVGTSGTLLFTAIRFAMGK